MSGKNPSLHHLSIVVPAYNEAERIGASLVRIREWIEAKGLDAEVLVVDDGSSDGTAKVAGDLLRGGAGRVLGSGENRGKGHAVRTGVLAATGRWVLFSDADLSTPIEEYESLARVAREHDLDVVIGSRSLPDSRVEVPQGPLRRVLGAGFRFLVTALTGLSHRDTQCGFKLMDRARIRPLFEKMILDGFAFDVELLFLCRRFGFSVREVPVTWRNDTRSSVRVGIDPLLMLRDILRVRWAFHRGRYAPDS